jgi:hypothetical protein
LQAGRDPPGYRDSEVFKLCQKGMENLRQQMREARQGGGNLPAGLPPVAPPGYNKLGGSAIPASGGLMPIPIAAAAAAAAAAAGVTRVRSSARASARNAAAALAAAAAAGNEDGEDSGGADRSDKDYSAGSADWFLPTGRGSGGRGRGRGSRGGRSSRGGWGGWGGRGGRGRGGSFSGYSSSSGGLGGLDDLDSDFGFEDTGRVKMMCPARMGGAGEEMVLPEQVDWTSVLLWT